MKLKPVNPVQKAVLYALAEMRLGSRARKLSLTLTYEGFKVG